MRAAILIAVLTGALGVAGPAHAGGANHTVVLPCGPKYADGVSSEAYLATARIRDSVARLRDLVDYELDRSSVRPAAYSGEILIYLDNLVAWADSLFRQGSRETVNEAARLYAAASKLLGEKPGVDVFEPSDHYIKVPSERGQVALDVDWTKDCP
jgi:hypothetical protein